MDDKDEIFEDLIEECNYVTQGTQHGDASSSQLSSGLRKRLERYKKDVRKEIVSQLKNGCAPLFIACRTGQVLIVEYLIVHCDADIEQRGRYEIPGDRSVHCSTPLWCAAVSGRLPVIKCLISHGADVNAVSDSGSTPVRSACFMTHIDVVECLVKNGADTLKPNYKGGTCLINSIQSVELCSFLLHHGADINATDIQNKTALHYAIQEHRLEITKFFIEHNANPHIRSQYNDDALQTACLKGATEIFKYLVENVDYPPERVADANELMGATFVDNHDDIHKALEYWKAAITIRSANAVHDVPMPKRPVLPRRDVYRNATEFTTLEDLNRIARDLDAIRIQSLLIYERVLGPHHKDTLYRLMHRGTFYMNIYRYQYCIDIWRWTLEIQVEKDSILHGDTCFTAQALLRRMVNLNEQTSEVFFNNPHQEVLRFDDVAAIFQLLSSQLKGARELLEKRPVYKSQQDSYNRIFKCVTHLMYLLVETAKSDDDKTFMQQIVYDLVTQNPRCVHTEDTLLHLCVTKTNTISRIDFPYDDQKYIIFPSTRVVKLLLECGAPVNAKNESRSSPLHIASEPDNFHNPLIKLLLDYGAHLDTPNKAGDTPVQLISANPQNNVKLVDYISLQCYAAQAILKYGIRSTNLPFTLQVFLRLH